MNEICTSCFENHGIKETALRVINKQADQVVCKSCLKNGYALSSEELLIIMNQFFVMGSIPPEVAGPAPIFQFNEYKYPGDVQFLTELDADLKKITDATRVGLFNYGPPLWRLGYTNHYQLLVFDNVQGKDRDNIWQAIISCCTEEILNVGYCIYRVRTGENLPPANSSEFDTPPQEYTKNGRFNSESTQIFYGASDIETCLHETRASLSDYIMLAKFSVEKPLKVLNLSRTNESKASTEFDRVDLMLQRLSYVGKDEYSLCQELSREIKLRGYDGFITNSYFGQAHKKELLNISLFGYPVAEKKLKITSTNNLKITSIAYEYSYGPVNDNHALDKSKLKLLGEKMSDIVLDSEASFDDVNKLMDELKSLVSCRSNKPI
ncbi:RES family NAD+ phosphorylase [Acinetobacter sp. S40]|uniref:RES family NAD+ phosphorylase n=1 Tax=Acinetobacter sp. S40 TaxID=2767434 RepID=UPI00190B9522|nr:RES family NAD+ phosphorylase [Acinetobacter sp. S40]MBJ9986982.1 RES family NAD+ phosphorylase [Acinetobacter sp. S40]